MIEEQSISQKIIEILEKESRLTINEMFEHSDLSNDKKGYFRLCVNRLKNAKNPKIVEDGKRAKEYLYSLKKNAKNPEVLLGELYNLMNNKMDFIKPAKNDDIGLITKIEKVLEIE